MNWHAHVTVATVVESEGRFLLVEECEEGRLVLNQPAGHLEQGETLIEAAKRETLEETGWSVEIQGIVGIALYTAPANGITYYRTTFYGQAIAHDPARALDEGITQALWLAPDEIRHESARLRSHMVIGVIEQYLAGHRYPLSMILA
ncbi:NUDIX hydrolase [Azomonas macrocytogenes]|uniref:Phosphatase NudJ n=1 Tax=Azomonas macrocytogenes TaxID=69962 RepID=A0A839SZM2_AZOMA|nr:NUDIX hydrolase [Azomonas macrocytogenes]MBB3101654.1 ADP-ribose pyrophosphatase YjhB (NUDIX family) [Azomonas macrocytogenes]